MTDLKTPAPTIISGVQPSGTLSLGNYLGALLPFSRFLKAGSHKVYFFLADHHAITVRQEPEALREQTFALAAWYIASGVNPNLCTLFVQSQVPQHAELGWILQSFTQMGELERMTQYKDKSKQHSQNINAGLFTYPALMAADILLYDTTEVPVGDDQTQHLELTRDIATRINNHYGPTLVVPKARIPEAAARVRDLQEPERKMSKSRPGGGTVLLTESADEITKKFKRAVTDNVGVVKYDPTNQPGVANLIEILSVCSNRMPQQVEADFAGGQYGPLKAAVAEAVVATLEPVQAEYRRLMADKGELQNILAKGADAARAKAEQTLTRVMRTMGYVLPPHRL